MLEHERILRSVTVASSETDNEKKQARRILWIKKNVVRMSKSEVYKEQHPIISEESKRNSTS